MPSSSQSMKPYKIEAGRLRFVIDLLQKVATTDAGGGESQALNTTTPVATLRADVRASSSREADRAMARGLDATHTIEMRYYAGLDPDWVVRFNGRLFSIVGVTNVGEMNRKHILTCQERTPTSSDHV